MKTKCGDEVNISAGILLIVGIVGMFFLAAFAVAHFTGCVGEPRQMDWQKQQTTVATPANR